MQGYLEDLEHGHRPGTPEAAIDPLERERLVTVLCNYCIGETAALDGASGLIAIAPNRLTKVFLSSQVADEGRRLEVLLRRLADLGVADPESEVEKRSSPSLQLFRRRLLELVASRDWEAAIFAQNGRRSGPPPPTSWTRGFGSPPRSTRWSAGSSCGRSSKRCDDKVAAAKLLGVSERTLWYKLEKHGV